MKLKSIFSVHPNAITADMALFLMRLVVGTAFMMHGWGKIQNPFAWMGEQAAVPAVFQFLAALSEFGGGFALIVGLLTRLAALGLTFTMIVAVLTHAVMMADPFVSPTGGRSYELAAVFLTIALYLTLHGPGQISLDYKVFGRRGK